MCLPIGCTEGGFNAGIVAAVLPVLTLKLNNSVSPCSFWHLLSHCPSSRAQGESLEMSNSVHRTFKRTFGFPVAFLLTLRDRIPTDLHSQMLQGLFFLALKPWLGSLVWSWGHSPLRGDLCSLSISQDSQPPQVGAGPAYFKFLALLTYGTSVQLVFRWFSRSTVL